MLPYNVLFSSFVILAVQALVNFVGKPVIELFIWSLYVKYASNKQLAHLRTQKTQLAQLQKDRNAISAQDQYAKWTKLSRSFDKLSAEIKSSEQAMSATRTSFSKYVGYAIMLLTTAPLWAYRFWYRKLPLFYLPPGLLPHSLEWVLSLPFSPLGSIGLGVWLFFVGNVLKQFQQAITFLSQPAPEKPASLSAGKPVVI